MMPGRNYTLLKVILFFFALNTLSLYLYFHPLSNPKSPQQPHNHLDDHNYPNPNPNNFLKPWPTLPSYLPWSDKSSVNPRSCEAYFGNGFRRRLDILSADGGGSGWFRCYYSDTLRSSVCEGGSVRMDPEKIRMVRGGERLKEVMGRGEDEEMPVFEDGAFRVLAGDFRLGRKVVSKDILDQYLPRGGIERHAMRDLIGSIRVVGESDFGCDQWIEEPTLLLTRYEYANMFHTMTDWYNAYISSRVTGLPYRPHVIFVDGHCMAPLEETWNAMFSDVTYAKHFTGSVCFRHAVFSPLGYENALFRGLSEHIDCHGASSHDLWENPDDSKTARLTEFGEMIRASFGFPVNRHRLEKSVSGHNVLFVRREDYLAHPRHSGKPESRLSNEQEVFDALNNWASNHLGCNINLINGLFAHMPMKGQVQAIQDASVIIGAHGAGLTHIVSATPKTVVLEIISSFYRRPHFELISQWRGLEYHAINLAGSYAAPNDVVDKLSAIMKTLGC